MAPPFAILLLWLGCSGDPTVEARADRPTDDTAPTTTTDASPAVTGDSTDTGTPAPPLEGWPVVPTSEAGLKTPFLARHAATGHLYLTWGERGNDGFTRVYLAVSTDDGATFSTPQQVSEPLQDATAGWPEGPVLAVGADRLYLAYGAYELGGTPYTIYVLDAPLPPAPPGPTPSVVPVDLQRTVRIEQPRSYHSINYPTLAIGPDGLAWLALVASPVYTGEIWVAREALGWAIEDVTATSPLEEPPCECCPPAFGMDPSGRVLVGWRGDIDKDLFLAESDGVAPFTGHRRVTDTDVSDLVCPQDGMEFFWLDGAMRLAWSDARPAAGRGYLSTEGPTGWSHEPILSGSGDEVQARVGAVPTAEGVLAHWDSGWGGEAWVATVGEARGRRVTVGDGRVLAQLRAIATPEGPLGVGVDPDGALWMVRPDSPLGPGEGTDAARTP